MNIGILGAGQMGAAIAGRLTSAGHGVVVGTRDVTRSWPHARIPLVSHQEAVGFGELTVLALAWPTGLSVIGSISVPPYHIFVDVSNPEATDGRSLVIGHHTSGAEELARMVPGASVLKAFSHFYAELLSEDVTFDGGVPSVLYCGDDPDAKQLLSKVIRSCGLDPVDAGPLSSARYLEPFAMLTVALVRDQGWGPTGVAWRLMRRV